MRHAFWLDTFCLDSEYDYDPVWAKCVELKVPPTFHSPGMGWSLGWGVVREPTGLTAALSPGTHGHGGALGTQAWIEPKHDAEPLHIE